jgi:uncharacterized membrane protein YkgB
MSKFLEQFDLAVIEQAHRHCLGATRWAFFVVYFWFGILKVLGLSPASPLVLALLAKTLPFIPPHAFMVGFGAFEVAVGVVFLVPRLERLAIGLLGAHLVTTLLPLLLLPSMAWQGPFVPTLEGQYIIKNVLMMALAANLAARLRPLCRIPASKKEISGTA